LTRPPDFVGGFLSFHFLDIPSLELEDDFKAAKNPERPNSAFTAQRVTFAP
jgi:hypothetical protein